MMMTKETVNIPMIPVTTRILVRLIKSEAKREEISAGGILLEINSQEDLERKQQAMGCGHILAMGPYVGHRRGVNFVATPGKVGDKIMFYKHAGTLLEDIGDGYVYRMIDDLEVEGVYPTGGIEL